MCNLYSLTKTRDELVNLFAITRDTIGDGFDFAEVYPDTLAPIVRLDEKGGRPSSARKSSTPLSVRAEASCASSSFGVIFRAMLRLGPGEGSDRFTRPLARRARGGDVAGFGFQKEGQRRRAARKAATQRAPSVSRDTSGSSEIARK